MSIWGLSTIHILLIRSDEQTHHLENEKYVKNMKINILELHSPTTDILLRLQTPDYQSLGQTFNQLLPLHLWPGTTCPPPSLPAWSSRAPPAITGSVNPEASQHQALRRSSPGSEWSPPPPLSPTRWVSSLRGISVQPPSLRGEV